MDEFGVDKAVVANINGIFYKDVDIANEELYQAIQSDSAFQKRFIPFAVMNPVLPWWERSIEEARKKYGMKGIRLYPRYHEYGLTEERCIELVKAARDLDLPVAIPQRMVDTRQRSWLDVNREVDYSDLAALVSEVPDAKYMMLDTRHYADEEDVQVLKKADILFDSTRASGVPIAGLNGTSLSYLRDTFGADKIAFGTGTPFIDYCTPFIRAGTWEEADPKTMDMLWSGNVRRMLGI
ncbi:MAG: hypothetical protein R3224_01960, partial [Balneolaceae bacterium]|nr:hypothetical protein [Balneolaceae bacterium]